MVTREILDRTMREKAASAGADIRECSFVSHEAQPDGSLRVKLRYRDGREEYENYDYVVGADGAGSQIAKSCGRIPVKHASAIQERLMLPDDAMEYYAHTAELYLGDDVFRPTFTAGSFPRATTSRSAPAAQTQKMPRNPHAFLEGASRHGGNKLRGARPDPLGGIRCLCSATKQARLRQNTMLVGDAGGWLRTRRVKRSYPRWRRDAWPRSTHSVLHATDHRSAAFTRTPEDLGRRKYGGDGVPTFSNFSIKRRSTYELQARVLRRHVRDARRPATTFDNYLFKEMAKMAPWRRDICAWRSRPQPARHRRLDAPAPAHRPSAAQIHCQRATPRGPAARSPRRPAADDTAVLAT